MLLSLKIPTKKEDVIRKAAIKAGKTKQTYIIEAVDEKLGLVKNRENQIRELAGWLSHDEAEELRKQLRFSIRLMILSVLTET